MSEPITEAWLKAVGFKWHQFERQSDQHWLLWLGSAIPGFMRDTEDLGIELAPVGRDGAWFCWMRSDAAGRYHRFLHIRYLYVTDEVEQLVAALIGQSWDPSNHIYGSVHAPRNAEAIRRSWERADNRIRRENAKWAEVEKDDSRGRALPEHMQAAIDGGKAK